MAESVTVTDRMVSQIQHWEQAGDRRSIFLSCYHLMTLNMLAAVEAGEFQDAPWVDLLLHRFADYYFAACDDYEQGRPLTPAVWQRTHAVARQPGTHVLQNLLLGVNAHINYDLVLTLVDLLEPEWPRLSAAQRALRYADHCHVNAVIARTVDIVQDTVVERLEPAMNVVDTLMGRMDEWVVSRLIRNWRDDVWRQAIRWIETAPPAERGPLRHDLERLVLRRADAILLRDGLPPLHHLL
jgi:hypothetical protein